MPACTAIIVEIFQAVHGPQVSNQIPNSWLSTKAIINKYNPLVVATTELGIMIKNEYIDRPVGGCTQVDEGDYVKKPYLFARLGQAVRTELSA